MNPPRCSQWVALLLLTLLLIPSVHAEGLEIPEELPSVITDALQNAESGDHLPGVVMAETVSQVTGVAISPLLGVSAVGAWKWWRADVEARADLPWFCHPIAWGIGFSVLLLCFLKDSIGTGLPMIFKAPFDFAEMFEDKLSALVASAAFVPVILTEVSNHFLSEQALATSISGDGSFLAAVVFSPILLLIPVFIAVFLVVWLSSHAINVLVTLSPFAIIDVFLKLFKGAMLLLVAATAFINPFLGAFFSGLIILVAIIMAPWAFRLTVFGTIFGLDVLLPSYGRNRRTVENPHAFLSRKIGNVPVRTFGRLTTNDIDETVFSYRVFFVGPEKTLLLEDGATRLSKGLLYPTLYQQDSTNPDRFRSLFLLPPRYRECEEAIGQHLGIQDLSDSTLLRGAKAVRNWLRETLNGGRQSMVLPAPGQT